ncbi:MAG: cyanophycinase [Pirellula sp.]
MLIMEPSWKTLAKQWLIGSAIGGAGFCVVAMAVALLVRQLHNLDDFSPSLTSFYGGGTLVIAGGGNLPPEIPAYFCRLAGGLNARIVVIPSYDATPKEEKDILREWKARRIASVNVARTRARGDDASCDLANNIKNATGVWFTGGEQSVPAAYYPGTDVESELWELLERGGVIGGTSAGAAIMSRVMIEQGRKQATTSQGLDLFRGAVIDQHFMHRNRLARLRGVLDAHPSTIGVGIDEGTALVVKVKSGRLKVIGNSYVMLWAPSESASPHRAEFLKSGDSYDLDELDWQDAPTDYIAPEANS